MNRFSDVQIFVVYDHRTFADEFVETPSSESDFDIVGQPHSITDTRRSLWATSKDVVLLDAQPVDENVATAIRRALEGQKTPGMNIAEQLSRCSFMPAASQHPPPVHETEILTGISKVLTAGEMSAQMGLALPTVRTCISRAFR